MRPSHLIASLILAGATSNAMAGGNEEKLIPIDALISVNTEGRLDEVSILRPELPEALRSAAEQQIRLLAFEPILENGQPVRITSPARFSACLRSDNDQVVMALEPLAFGPLHAEAIKSPARVAIRAIGPRNGEFGVTLRFIVHPDGQARFESMQTRNVPKRSLAEMERGYRDWIEKHPFIPERVNDVAVKTRMELPMSISMTRVASARPPQQPETSVCAQARALMEESGNPKLMAGEERLRLRRNPS